MWGREDGGWCKAGSRMQHQLHKGMGERGRRRQDVFQSSQFFLQPPCCKALAEERESSAVIQWALSSCNATAWLPAPGIPLGAGSRGSVSTGGRARSVLMAPESCCLCGVGCKQQTCHGKDMPCMDTKTGSKIVGFTKHSSLASRETWRC